MAYFFEDPIQEENTRRQRALSNIASAYGGLVKQQQQQADTERQRALQAMQFEQGLAKQGIDLDPTQREAVRLSFAGDQQPSSIKDMIFGDDEGGMTEEGRKATMGDILTKQAMAVKDRRAAEAAEKAEEKRYKRSIDERRLALQESGLQAREAERAAKKQAAEEKKAYEASPKGKLEKLGGESRSKVGSIVSGLQALQKMGEASKSGYGPEYFDPSTPLIGGMFSDTPYSENERVLSEVVGRLQSGGAIGQEELKTFKAMGPRPADDPSTRQSKLENQRKFLANKLTAFGLSEDELGAAGFDYNPQQKEMVAGATPEGLSDVTLPEGAAQIPFRPSQGGLINNAVASQDVQEFIKPERTQARQSRIQELLNKAKGR